MAGGTWIDQNKARPGVYINYKSAPESLGTIGERGVVAIAHDIPWGETEKIIEIESMNDCAKLGYKPSANEMKFIRTIFKGSNRTNGAKKILVWRLLGTSGKAATATSESLTITANYTGARGNDITIVITADPKAAAETPTLIVQTLLDSEVVDSQVVSGESSQAPEISQLKKNAYVTFSGSGNLTASAGIKLTGGASGNIETSAYDNFLKEIEKYSFDVLIYDGKDAGVKEAHAALAKSLSNEQGFKCQAVVSDYAAADNECVISAFPQTILFENPKDNLVDNESVSEITWWIGGATAGANANESLTYSAIPAAIGTEPKLTSSEQIKAINSGNIAFIEQFGKVQVLQDINTFTTFAVDKGKAFRKNRVIRTLFGLCNDIYKTFSQYYIGAVNNNEEGRKALKVEILNLMNKYQGNSALQNVIADDVIVSPGVDSDAVLIEIYMQPVDSIEKIYVNITIS